ncbi:MAG TPA: hypothetical protein VE685_03440 [Thermoanaerobaculia bacterium]|nr:hypothetical protein [Thermoanaerobaculia bacterium]
MRIVRSTSFLTALVAAVLLAGCGSSGVGDILGGGRDTRTNDRYDPYTTGDVRGTVERVDTLDRFIVVNVEGTGYRSDLRNGNDDEVTLYYDDRTRVEFEGQTYQPDDLERGDRIQADVEQSGSRLFVQDIEVLYDVTGGNQNDRYSQDDRYRDDDLASRELRGTVRYLNTRDRTLEIQPSSSGFSTGRTDDIVVVHYDSGTIVEFEGRRYQPENLERGDVVEIELSGSNNRLMAEEILVVSESSLSRR